MLLNLKSLLAQVGATHDFNIQYSRPFSTHFDVLWPLQSGLSSFFSLLAYTNSFFSPN